MREFVGEHYLPAEAGPDAGHCAKAARAVADQLQREGTRVHHVRSILIPEDETCIHLYRAESMEAVRVAAARASLRLDRLTEAVSNTGAATRGNTALVLELGLDVEPPPAAGPRPLVSSLPVTGDARARLERSHGLPGGPGGARLRVTSF